MAFDRTEIIDPKMCQEYIQKIEEKNKKMRATLNEIQNKINGLKGDYESDAAESIREKITNMSPKFDQYEKVVSQYAKFIQEIIDKGVNLDKAIANNASQFK